MSNRKSSGRMASKGLPNQVDVEVGRRLRQIRTEQGLSQEVVADYVGLTFQQVQKYENGSNRVSASRMVDFASLFKVEPGYFVNNLPHAVLAQSPARLAHSGEAPTAIERSPAGGRMALETSRLVGSLSGEYQKLIHDLARGLLRANKV